MRFFSILARVLTVVVLIVSSAGDIALAQPATNRPKPRSAASPEAKRLDAKLEQVADLFMRDTATLITSYENIGQFDRARMLLEAVQKLDPENAQVKTKLSALKEKILVANEFEFTFDPDGSWHEVGPIERGRPVRILIEGDYRFSFGLTGTADGVPNGAPGEGLIAGLPLGAVVGVILSPEQLATPANGKRNDKPPRPFLVGRSFERPAEQDGMFFLKTNLPPGAKGTGRMKARISGPTRSE